MSAPVPATVGCKKHIGCERINSCDGRFGCLHTCAIFVHCAGCFCGMVLRTSIRLPAGTVHRRLPVSPSANVHTVHDYFVVGALATNISLCILPFQLLKSRKSEEVCTTKT